MVICAIFGCVNRSGRDKEKGYFRLPSVITHQGPQTQELSKKKQELWVARIRRDDLKPEQYPNTRVCSDHFVGGSPAQLFDVSNPDWAPTLNLGYSFGLGETSKERYERRMARKRQHVETENEEDSPPAAQNDNVVAVQTLLHSNDLTTLQSEAKKMKDENMILKAKVQMLKNEVEELTLNEKYFRDDDKKVLYYTGLSTWELLHKLFTYVKPSLKGHSILSPFQQLILTLMRLRLNLSGQDLGYRFKVNSSTISRTFLHVIEVLYTKLKPLIIWPDRDNLKKTMPMVFRKHSPNCIVIIDCFEIFLDRPTNLLARAQTYSSYKHHNTIKYLIGITPQGTVSYISDGWGGRTSDKYLTEHCSLLNNLIPGDTILADRGFDISNSVGYYCSKIEIPAFTKGKAQLSGIELEQTRNIANVRIHVERVIGNIRKKIFPSQCNSTN